MAAQNVGGSVTVNVQLNQTDIAGLVAPIVGSGNAQLVNQFIAQGTGVANGIDCLYAKQLTLSAAATHINLNSFTDILGNTVAAARVRLWYLQVVTLTAGSIVNVYTRTGTNPVTWLPITTSGALWATPGGILLGVDQNSTTTNGWVVGSSANDFTVDPGANTVVCNLIIAGNTAA
jgi:hypothetical protein